MHEEHAEMATHALPAGTIIDAGPRALSAFFFWSVWAAATSRG